MKAMIEAILLTTENPLSIDEIKKCSGASKSEIMKYLNELKEKYSSEDSGIEVSEIGGYKIVVKNQYLDNIASLTPHADISRGLLRVLSLIAFHQPVSQAKIVKLVGNRTYQHVKDLKKRGFIKSEKKSRTAMLSTTDYFEKYFRTKKEEIKKMYSK